MKRYNAMTLLRLTVRATVRLWLAWWRRVRDRCPECGCALRVKGATHRYVLRCVNCEEEEWPDILEGEER